MGQFMDAGGACLAAIRTAAFGLLVYAVAEIGGLAGAPATSAMEAAMLVANGLVALASFSILMWSRRCWAAIAFAATCFGVAALSTAVALPTRTEPTAWVVVAQMLVLSAVGVVHLSRLTQVNVERALRGATAVAAAMCGLFGAIHLLNIEAISSLIPGWIPFRGELPLVTGSILIVAAIALMARASRAIGALVVSGMFVSWILLLHIPRLAAQLAEPSEWSFAAMAIALAGALASLAFGDAMAVRRPEPNAARTG